AVSGLMSTIGYPDRPPVRIGASVIDMGTGILSAFLVVSALVDRSDGAGGEYFDVSLFETAVSWMGYWIARYTDSGAVPDQSGQGFADIVPYEIFRAGDDEPFYLAVINDRLWKRFCDVLDLDDLATDPRFETNDDRYEHQAELRERLREEFGRYDRDTLVEVLAEANVPVGPLQHVDELVEADEQIIARDLLTDSYNVRTDTPVKTTGVPFKTADGRPRLDGRPPAVGEDSAAVLSEVGYSDAEIDRLIRDGVVVSADD
ncbi:MAG: CaiB/BaiF CoA transferase family protein, partial [Halanaeroarchaeum sp.]